MYRKPGRQLSLLDDFYLPFSGKLRADNRWVELSQIIPWKEIEKKYSALFADGLGAPAKPVRMALGALVIKEKCGYSDREKGRTDYGKSISSILRWIKRISR